jgi:hypothetical protein
MPLSQLLGRVEVTGDALALEVPPDWMQGRSVFGGLQAALALGAMRSLVPDLPLRTLQATFIAPVPTGRVVAHARVLRRGKHAIHVEARLGEGDPDQAIVLGVFGAARPSAVSQAPVRAEASLGRGISLPFVPGLSPAFLQHFPGVRWLAGQPPLSGYPGTEHVVELAMDEAGPASEAHAIAIADVLPPLALTRLTAVVPGSTLAWMLELLVDRFDHLPLAGWRLDGLLEAARDGYTSQTVMVWGPDGAATAVSRQCMLVFG